MFKSWIAYVVHALKSCMLFGVCLLSFVLGLFAVSLGISHGAWDGILIILALTGLVGFLVLLQLYIMPFCEWLGRKEEELEAEMCEEEALDAVCLEEEKPVALLEKRIAYLEDRLAKFMEDSDLTHKHFQELIEMLGERQDKVEGVGMLNLFKQTGILFDMCVDQQKEIATLKSKEDGWDAF